MIDRQLVQLDVFRRTMSATIFKPSPCLYKYQVKHENQENGRKLQPQDRLGIAKEIVARKNQDGTVILMRLDESTSFFKITGIAAEIWYAIETPRLLGDLLEAFAGSSAPAERAQEVCDFLQETVTRGLAQIVASAPSGAESVLAGPKSEAFGGIREFNLEQIESEVLHESVYLDVFAGSDFRLKKNIQPIEDALDKLASLQGVTFEWNESQYPSAWPTPSMRPQAGLIAQEVAAVMPELVRQDEASGYLTMDYPKLTSYLVEAVKELQERVRALESSRT